VRQWDARDTLPDKHPNGLFGARDLQIYKTISPSTIIIHKALFVFRSCVVWPPAEYLLGRRATFSVGRTELIGSCNIGAPAFPPALSHRKRFSHWAVGKRPARADFGFPSGVQRYAVRLGGGEHVPECVSRLL